MIISAKRLLTAPVLALTIIIQACGAGGFASQLRLILAASGPLINSLPIGDPQKRALIVDFQDLGQGAAILADDLKACQSDKPCKLNAVDRFAQRFLDVHRRGHFGSHEKLKNVELILRGIIQAARIYYGGGSQGEVASVTEDDLKAKLKELKVAMKP